MSKGKTEEEEGGGRPRALHGLTLLLSLSLPLALSSSDSLRILVLPSVRRAANRVFVPPVSQSVSG